MQTFALQLSIAAVGNAVLKQENAFILLLWGQGPQADSCNGKGTLIDGFNMSHATA